MSGGTITIDDALLDMTREELAAQVRSLTARLQLAQLKLIGIQEIGRILASDHNLDRVLAEIIKRTTALMQADRSTLFLLGPDGKTMWSKSTHGGTVKTIELGVGQGIAGWVARYGRPVNVKDAYKDQRFDADVDRASGYRTRSILCQPLVDSQQRVLGVIQVLNKCDGYFTTADEDLLAAVASQAAVCIQNSKLYLDVVTKNIDLLDTQLKLEERTKEIELFFRIERAAATARSTEEALYATLDKTIAEYPCEATALLLYDQARHCLVVDRVTGDAGWLRGDISVDQTLAGEVFQAGRPRNVRPGSPHQRAELGVPLPPGFILHNAVCVPISAQEGPLGCLLLLNRKKDPRGFDSRDLRILGVIASRMALSIVLGRAQEEERKAERLASIGTMLSGVLHDLKTPLTIIGGYSRMMSREDDGEKREEHRARIKKQIGALSTMTGELLAFARGESEILIRKVFVKEFLAELQELLAEEFNRSPVELVVEDEFRGAVKMDADKMKRVVFNLARNAREAMSDAGGRFMVRVTATDTHVQFAFSDDGPGIPPEMEGRLFDSFASYGKENGTGLGLAIVKKIVEEHNGTIAVDSAPTTGTTFRISIPRVE